MFVFLFVATITLTIVFIAEYGFDFKPCALCLWQRLPWSFVIFIALCDLLFWRKMQNIWLFYSVIMMASAALAFYHIGVEHGFWQSFISQCSGDFTATNVEEALKLLQNPKASAACDSRNVFLFGLSFSDYNFLLSTGLGLFALLPFIGYNRK